MSTFKLSEAFKVATDAERNNPVHGMAETLSKSMAGAQFVPARGMVETLSKSMAGAQLAPMRGMVETLSKSMTGAQLAPALGMAGAQLGPALGMVETLSKSMTGAQLAPMRGMVETLFLSASPRSLGIDAALKAALSPSFGTMNQALLGSFADIERALSSLSALEAIDVDRLKRLSALAAARNANAALERERIRQLWGYYIYVQVWMICLLVLVGAWKMDNTVAALIGIGLSMTGWTGKSVASRAREIALDNFDRMYPPGSDMPQITNILI